jgi:MYXO-CTERM domain-containing protein
MNRFLYLVAGTSVLLAAVAQASTYGPSFVEPGDAGSTRDTAADVKNADGTGDINFISGELSGSNGFRSGAGDYQDVYRIFINNPSIFKIELLDVAFGVPDSMMFLFNEFGNPIMASNNADSQTLNPILNNQGNEFFNTPGVYYLAITSAPSEALVYLDNQFISLFDLANNPFGVVGPAPNTGDFVWDDAWSEPDFGNFGSYMMSVDGVVSLPIPAPAALALLGLAGLAGRRRRRL